MGQTQYLDLITQPLESLDARGCSEDEESKQELQAKTPENGSPGHLGTKSRAGTERLAKALDFPLCLPAPLTAAHGKHHHTVPWVTVLGVLVKKVS